MLSAEGIKDPSRQVSLITAVLNGGGIAGCLCFPLVADRWGRKTALALYFLGGFLSVPTTFLTAKEFTQALILSPIVGFFGGGIFTGFAVYLPELFPTAIRATAQGFCYNFARFFSAVAPFLTGALVSARGNFSSAITIVGMIYLAGLVVLIFARETKNQTLPE
jgi:MFS family permease